MTSGSNVGQIRLNTFHGYLEKKNCLISQLIFRVNLARNCNFLPKKCFGLKSRSILKIFCLKRSISFFCHLLKSNLLYQNCCFRIQIGQFWPISLILVKSQSFSGHFSLFSVTFGFFWLKVRMKLKRKLGCAVRMVVASLLLHAESGPNDPRKDAPPFILISRIVRLME